MKDIRILFTLIFGVVVTLFFGIEYPHHLHYQEQFQLFLFDNDYVKDIVRLPGGVADLLGRFCTQFFLYAWTGAIIIGVLLSVVQLLTLRLARWGYLYGLSFVPACILWLFLLDENALLGGVWAILLTLLVSWLFDKLPNGRMHGIILVIAVPTLYWLVGPVSIVFFLLQARSQRNNARYYGVFLVWIVMLVIASFYVPVPADRLWIGVHYHRYPTECPTLLWVASLSVFVLALIARLFEKWTNSYSRLVVSICSFAVVVVAMGGVVWKNANFKAEKTMQYDFMACHQQWNRILDAINAEKPNNQIGVTVQNLALAMQGVLPQQMFNYNQNGLMGLLPAVQRDATSPMPTAEAFYHLGMINVAQRTVFEAQESILDFQKSARCYKRLAQTNLINGNYEVARKYLVALQKTIFYKDWANETIQLLGNEKAIAQHSEYGHLRQMRYNEDFYFSDQATPKMLEDLYLCNTKNNMAYQYMMAAFMLTGDRDSFFKYAPKNR